MSFILSKKLKVILWIVRTISQTGYQSSADRPRLGSALGEPLIWMHMFIGIFWKTPKADCLIFIIRAIYSATFFGNLTWQNTGLIVLAKMLFIWCVQNHMPETAMLFWVQGQVRPLYRCSCMNINMVTNYIILRKHEELLRVSPTRAKSWLTNLWLDLSFIVFFIILCASNWQAHLTL